jgi:hypothetical protein
MAALEALDKRLHSVGETGDIFFVGVNTKTGTMDGEDGPVRATYGDLFDIAETAECAQSAVTHFIVDIATGRADPETAMRSLYMLAVAHGCLMERKRWER